MEIKVTDANAGIWGEGGRMEISLGSLLCSKEQLQLLILSWDRHLLELRAGCFLPWVLVFMAFFYLKHSAFNYVPIILLLYAGIWWNQKIIYLRQKKGYCEYLVTILPSTTRTSKSYLRIFFSCWILHCD